MAVIQGPQQVVVESPPCVLHLRGSEPETTCLLRLNGSGQFLTTFNFHAVAVALATLAAER